MLRSQGSLNSFLSSGIHALTSGLGPSAIKTRSKSTISAIKRGSIRSSRVQGRQGGSSLKSLSRTSGAKGSSNTRFSATRPSLSETGGRSLRHRDQSATDHNSLTSSSNPYQGRRSRDTFTSRRDVRRLQGPSDTSVRQDLRSARYAKARSRRDDPVPRTRLDPESYREDPESFSMKQSNDIQSLKSSRQYGNSEPQSTQARQVERERRMPISVPYSAADSEFLYGTSVVTAALRARRRVLRKLYIHPRALTGTAEAKALQRLANEVLSEGNVKHVSDTWLPRMNLMSGNRPHNGIVLEASPLPKRHVVALEATESSTGAFARFIGLQTLRSETTSRRQDNPKNNSDGRRHPFVLLLDDILDPGNFGAIIRSAYYLGVDALVTDSRTCAPLSNVALKASAGAAEVMQILTVDNAAEFLKQSKMNGWSIYAGVTPETGAQKRTLKPHRPSKIDVQESHEPEVHFSTAGSRSPLPTDHSPLLEAPCILVLGGEGSGLRRALRSEADYNVSLSGTKRYSEAGVDSLNVSVATAILAAEFLRTSRHGHGPARHGQSTDDKNDMGF